MLKFKNLYVIGTSHIAIESVREVERVLLDLKPEVVALELDLPRFKALLSPKKRKLSLGDLKRLGLKGFIFNLIGAWVEKKLGEVVGVPPGSEMLKAVSIAHHLNADIALIDQDISITLSHLSRAITWKERFRFVFDLFKGLVTRKPVIHFDLRKVPSKEVIQKLILKVKKDYPSLYKVLIAERNAYMSKNLYNLMSFGKKTVAVIGAGHEEELISLIKSYDQLQKAKLVLLKHHKNG